LSPGVNATFDFAFVSHAPMETLSAVADVRPDRAEVWAACTSPIIGLQEIAAACNLPQSAVTVNVIRAGGSFGRRLFYDAPVEAAQISKKLGRPVKLLWSRTDDMRHGRMRSASRHKLRAVLSPLSILPGLRGGTDLRAPDRRRTDRFLARTRRGDHRRRVRPAARPGQPVGVRTDDRQPLQLRGGQRAVQRPTSGSIPAAGVRSSPPLSVRRMRS